MDNWATYKQKVIKAISTSLHPTDDSDGQNLTVLSGLEGEAEVQAQQVIMNLGTMIPEAVLERLDALFMPRQESALAQLEFQQYWYLPNEPVLTYLMTKRALYMEGWPDPNTQEIKFLNLETIKGLKCVKRPSPLLSS